MWQSFWHAVGGPIHTALTFLAHIFDLATGLGILLAFGAIPYFFSSKRRQEIFESKDSGLMVLLGCGLTSLALIVFHVFKIPTSFDMHGDFLECSKCHEMIEEIKCPKCGETYSSNPISELPWAYAEHDDN